MLQSYTRRRARVEHSTGIVGQTMDVLGVNCTRTVRRVQNSALPVRSTRTAMHSLVLVQRTSTAGAVSPPLYSKHVSPVHPSVLQYSTVLGQHEFPVPYSYTYDTVSYRCRSHLSTAASPTKNTLVQQVGMQMRTMPVVVRVRSTVQSVCNRVVVHGIKLLEHDSIGRRSIKANH